MTDPDYFTLDEFRQLPDMTAVTDSQILAAAAYFTTIVEREIGYPLIPRTLTVTLDGSGTEGVWLPYYATSLVSVVLNGAALDPTALSVSSGALRYKNCSHWPTGVDSLVVTYISAKFATCPADIKDAVMWAVRDRLLGQDDRAGIDIRRTSQSNELGGLTTYVLPGENRPTGYPDLDALIASYKRVPEFYGSLGIA